MDNPLDEAQGESAALTGEISPPLGPIKSPQHQMETMTPDERAAFLKKRKRKLKALKELRKEEEEKAKILMPPPPLTRLDLDKMFSKLRMKRARLKSESASRENPNDMDAALENLFDDISEMGGLPRDISILLDEVEVIRDLCKKAGQGANIPGKDIDLGGVSPRSKKALAQQKKKQKAKQITGTQILHEIGFFNFLSDDIHRLYKSIKEPSITAQVRYKDWRHHALSGEFVMATLLREACDETQEKARLYGADKVAA